MAKNLRRKYWRSLLLMFILIAGLWGTGIWGYTKDVDAAEKKKEDKPTLIPLGLDLQGGISVVLEPKEGQPTDTGSLEKARDIILQRIDALGVAEPEVAIQGTNVLIQLPGIKDQTRALQLIGTTAKLRFRPVLAHVTLGNEPKGLKVPDCRDPDTWPEDDPKKEIVLCAKPQERLESGEVPGPESWQKYHLGPAELEGDDVSTARAALPAGNPTWTVELDLNSEGEAKFKKLTGELACKRGQGAQDQLAIVLDRVIESHPGMDEQIKCREGIGGGQAIISGNFGEREAKDLGLVLKYGALPVELERSTVTTVSPTLGKESLRSGLLAGVIGLGIVFLYVLVFYRALGLIIWVGLAIHGAFTLAIVIILGQTAGFALSLAGIAGLVVSLGVGADSFIVYFERVKDEVLSGRTVKSAVDRAWGSAWRTIVAADLVTALAAIVLYLLAVGSVRGFALMLGVATFLDLFVSRLFMHPSVWLLAQTKRFNESRTLGMRSVAGMGATAPAVSGGQS